MQALSLASPSIISQKSPFQTVSTARQVAVYLGLIFCNFTVTLGFAAKPKSIVSRAPLSFRPAYSFQTLIEWHLRSNDAGPSSSAVSALSMA